MAAMEKIDWSDCPLVEVKPGMQSGAPLLRGTRMPVDAILTPMSRPPQLYTHSFAASAMA